MPINVVSDAASILWRIGAYGYDVPDGLWDNIAHYAGAKFPKAGHAFIDAHMAMIEAKTGDRRAFHARVAGDGTLGAGAVVPTIWRAMLAFADADARTIALLEPVTREIARIGGSGAQREVVEDTLLIAYMRADHAAKAQALLDRKLHRRRSLRDARWLEGLAA